MARLTREDWIEAAYRAFSSDGVAAVRVEAVARGLGATKGSFYWHFADRRALVDAVLERWDERETEGIIAAVDHIADPAQRLWALLETIAHRTPDRSGERTLYADAAALEVRDAVTRSTERRVSYTASVLEALGLERGEARRRAVIVVAAVIGYAQLAAGGWDPGAEAAPMPLVDTLYRLATMPSS